MASLQGGAGGHGLDLVELDLGHSTYPLPAPVVLGQMGVWLNWLCSWATWWNIQIKVNPTQVHDHKPHPVVMYSGQRLGHFQTFAMSRMEFFF